MQKGDLIEDEDRWKVLSLTHVEYREGDSLGKLFALYSLLPLAIVIVFLTAFFFRRDLHTLTFGVGVIVNYAANTVLKKYIAEPRPKLRYDIETKLITNVETSNLVSDLSSLKSLGCRAATASSCGSVLPI